MSSMAPDLSSNERKPVFRHGLSRIMRAKVVVMEMLSSCIGLEMSDVAVELSEEMACRLKVSRLALTSTLLTTNGLLTVENIKRTAWTVAGNLSALSSGIPVTPFDYQPTPEWALVRVVDCRRELSVGRIGLPGFALRFFILTGPTAGLKFKRAWQDGMAAKLARHVGIRKRDCSRFTERWLVGCYACVDLLPPRNELDVATFKHSHELPSLAQLNRKLLAGRLGPCHFGLRPGFYLTCAQCERGYLPESKYSCLYATRPLSEESCGEPVTAGA